MTVYIAKISKNCIELHNLTSGAVARGTANFSSKRLLLGDYPAAEILIKELFVQVKSASWLQSARIVIQPLEMTEGGLSWVEEKTFNELGLSVGARQIKLHCSADLTSDQAHMMF